MREDINRYVAEYFRDTFGFLLFVIYLKTIASGLPSHTPLMIRHPSRTIQQPLVRGIFLQAIHS